MKLLKIITWHSRGCEPLASFLGNTECIPLNSGVSRKTMKRILASSMLVLLLCYCSPRQPQPPANSIMIISPYRHAGTWVFDDPNTELVREPLVTGVPEMIDHL